MNKERTFNLTLEDAEFVVEELPYNDGFTRALRAWCIEERAERDAAEARAQERWERLAPEWNAFIWRVTGRG